MTTRTPTKDDSYGRHAENDAATSTVTDRQALIDGLNHDLAGEY